MQPDIIPYIYKPTGNTLTDSEGMEYPEKAPIEGYHVNFPAEVPELAQYKVEPQPVTPHRMYQGNIMPVAYKFPDEATFRELFPEPEEPAGATGSDSE